MEGWTVVKVGARLWNMRKKIGRYRNIEIVKKCEA